MFFQIVIKLLTAFYLLFNGIVWALIKQIIPYKFRCKIVQGEIVLITGTGSGIGRLLAKRFARLGARVICVDKDQTNNLKTCAEIRDLDGDAYALQCDLSIREEIYKLADEVKQSIGNPTILVNNAGIVTGKKLLDSPDHMIELSFKVNTLAHLWLTKTFLPDMIKKNHGHIVSIASMAGIFGAAGLVDYCSSKFGAVGFDEALRNELLRMEKTGIKNTVVCPNVINTGMFNGFKTDGFPLLEPEYVADKIIEAILTNQEILMLPRLCYFMYALKPILPVKFAEFLDKEVFRLCYAMDNFVGRKSL